MPRKSLQAERTEEILDAFERCVIRFGVEGAGLQRVADEAGLTRSLLRHHVGNREDLLQAMVARFTRRGEEQAAEFEQYMPQRDRVVTMIEMMFDADYQASSHATLLYQALMVAAHTRPQLRETLRDWYDGYIDAVRMELEAEYPSASRLHIGAVAVGIIALYFNVDSMAAISSDKCLFEESKLAAHKLVETL